MRDDIKQALAKNKELNKLFTTFMFGRMFKNIEGYLKSDETVLYIRNANVQVDKYGEMKPNSLSIKGKRPVLLAVTDKRVMIYYKILFNEILEQFPIQEIRSYGFSKDLLSSKLRITSLTKSVDVDLTCNIKEAKHLNDILEKVTRKATTL